jgi:hypothetical protein
VAPVPYFKKIPSSRIFPTQSKVKIAFLWNQYEYFKVEETIIVFVAWMKWLKFLHYTKRINKRENLRNLLSFVLCTHDRDRGFSSICVGVDDDTYSALLRIIKKQKNHALNLKIKFKYFKMFVFFLLGDRIFVRFEMGQEHYADCLV